MAKRFLENSVHTLGVHNMANVRQLPSGSYNAQVRIKGQPQRSKTFPTAEEAQTWVKQQETISKEHKTHTIYTLGMAYRESRLKGRGSYGQALVILQQLAGFYPVNADTSKKTDHGQKGVSCPSEESSATSSSGRPSA
jgi:hypothetical protein